MKLNVSFSESDQQFPVEFADVIILGARENLTLTDTATGTNYILYVSNGKLMMKEE